MLVGGATAFCDDDDDASILSGAHYKTRQWTPRLVNRHLQTARRWGTAARKASLCTKRPPGSQWAVNAVCGKIFWQLEFRL